MNEVWKPIKNYEGVYEVSNLGNVRGLNRIDADNKRIKGRVLRQCSNSKYLTVQLCMDGKPIRRYVHRLVAETFIENIDDKPQVNHIDENYRNNKSSNLNWMTRKENSNWATSQIRKVMNRDYRDMALKMKKRLIQYDKDMNEIARWDGLLDMCKETGYNKDNVSESCLGKRKTLTYGSYWRYE